MEGVAVSIRFDSTDLFSQRAPVHENRRENCRLSATRARAIFSTGWFRAANFVAGERRQKLIENRCSTKKRGGCAAAS